MSKHTQDIYSRSKENQTNNFELYLNDVYKKECVLKASEKEVEFIQIGIETLVQKIVDLVIDDLGGEYVYIQKELLVFFNKIGPDDYTHVKIERNELIKVGSFYESTKNNFPDEFDFICTLFHVREKENYNFNSIHSSIQEVTTSNKQSLISKSDDRRTVIGELRFDQYLQEHGPASKLRFIYINSSGDRRNIHVHFVPAIKITPEHMGGRLRWEAKKSPNNCNFPKSFHDDIVARKTCLVVSGNYSFTETEVHFMRHVLSEKHRKVYRILKFLINGHGDGTMLKLVIPLSGISSDEIKMMIINHHDECTDTDTDHIGNCVMKILEQIHHIGPYFKTLNENLEALKATDDTYSYDQIRTKSASRQWLDEMDINDPNYDFWFRYLDTLGEDDPRMDSFEHFLDAEIPGWREEKYQNLVEQFKPEKGFCLVM